jgi:hypothetical protein
MYEQLSRAEKQLEQSKGQAKTRPTNQKAKKPTKNSPL